MFLLIVFYSLRTVPLVFEFIPSSVCIELDNIAILIIAAIFIVETIYQVASIGEVILNFRGLVKHMKVKKKGEKVQKRGGKVDFA